MIQVRNTSSTLQMLHFSLTIINPSWLTDSNTLLILNMRVELRIRDDTVIMKHHTMTLAESQLKYQPMTNGDHIPTYDTRRMHTSL